MEYTVTGQLTSYQIKSLHSSPVQIVAPPGVGNAIIVLRSISSYLYGGNNPFTTTGGAYIGLWYGTAGNSINSQWFCQSSTLKGIINFSQAATGFFGLDNASLDNAALNLYNPIPTEIAGNSSNDNVLKYSVTYTIITL